MLEELLAVEFVPTKGVVLVGGGSGEGRRKRSGRRRQRKRCESWKIKVWKKTLMERRDRDVSVLDRVVPAAETDMADRRDGLRVLPTKKFISTNI